MKVTAVPERKPDILIELSNEEAERLKGLLGSSYHPLQDNEFVNLLRDSLNALGVKSPYSFSGSWSSKE